VADVMGANAPTESANLDARRDVIPVGCLSFGLVRQLLSGVSNESVGQWRAHLDVCKTEALSTNLLKQQVVTNPRLRDCTDARWKRLVGCHLVACPELLLRRKRVHAECAEKKDEQRSIHETGDARRIVQSNDWER